MAEELAQAVVLELSSPPPPRCTRKQPPATESSGGPAATAGAFGGCSSGAWLRDGGVGLSVAADVPTRATRELRPDIARSAGVSRGIVCSALRGSPLRKLHKIPCGRCIKSG